MWHRELTFKFPVYYPFYWTAWLTVGGTFILLLGLANYPDPSMLLGVAFTVLVLMCLANDWVAAGLIWTAASVFALAAYYFLESNPMPLDEALRIVLIYFAYILLGAGITHQRTRAIARTDQPDPTLFTMAHELRTPLQSISSTVVGIRSVLPKLIAGYQASVEAGFDVPRIRPDKIKRLNDATEQISQVVRDGQTTLTMLLDLSRDKLSEESLEEINATSAVQASINTCPYVAMENSVAVSLNTATNFRFNGNEPLIKSVMHNLLKNAVHFAMKGSNSVEVSIDQSGSFGIIRVIDYGPGIPPHILPHIFDPYFTSQPAGLGSGLGLAFVKKVVDAHKGTIEARNHAGGGAEFMIVLPCL